ncbi:hypothetical protein [Clostridium sp.]|nr:hypothetical protein [Clostridium sp.]MBK5242175.1 hypothetical protein [Clostridium sp.]
MFYRYADDHQEMYRKAVTAYTSNIPIYVNGYARVIANSSVGVKLK